MVLSSYEPFMILRLIWFGPMWTLYDIEVPVALSSYEPFMVLRLIRLWSHVDPFWCWDSFKWRRVWFMLCFQLASSMIYAWYWLRVWFMLDLDIGVKYGLYLTWILAYVWIIHNLGICEPIMVLRLQWLCTHVNPLWYQGFYGLDPCEPFMK